MYVLITAIYIERPHIAIYVSSYYEVSSYYFVSSYYDMYVSSYYYVCFLVLLCMFPHTTICVLILLYVSSYYYMRFLVLLRVSSGLLYI